MGANLDSGVHAAKRSIELIDCYARERDEFGLQIDYPTDELILILILAKDQAHSNVTLYERKGS
jgi:hypothetical protein